MQQRAPFNGRPSPKSQVIGQACSRVTLYRLNKQWEVITLEQMTSHMTLNAEYTAQTRTKTNKKSFLQERD